METLNQLGQRDTFISSKGYEMWKFTDTYNKQVKIMSAHRTIYRLFYGDIPTGWEIHHKDFNKLNNCIDNLIALPKYLHRIVHNLKIAM